MFYIMGKKDEKVANLENATHFKVYRASHVLVDLGWVYLDLGSSPGWWATTVASYCPSRVVEHPKSKSTKPSLQGHGTPCTVHVLIINNLQMIGKR